MYRPAQNSGDTLAVPRLLFSKLDKCDEASFRVALYVLANAPADAARVARMLRLPSEQVRAELRFWEGAGLLEQDEAPACAPEAEAPPLRKKLSTRQTVKAGEADPTLGALLGELQRVFGAVVGESDANGFATLYVLDGAPPDLILMAASEAARHGAHSARYVEKVLEGWRRQGIHDCAAADKYLKLLAKREKREQALAARWGLPPGGFTLAEKKKIAQWYEEYAYDDAMADAARLSAGEDKKNDIKYISGILRKWHANGYRTPRGVLEAEGGRNLRVTRSAPVPNKAKKDLLADVTDYVPMKRRMRE